MPSLSHLDSALRLGCFRGLLAGAWLICLALVLPAQAEELRPVSLQLKWRHQFQFAGYYLALERGYYRDAGIDLRILPWRPGIDAMDEVQSERADFGIAGSELVLAHVQGRPLVSLAVIFQHSPAVLFARREAGIGSVHDLPGKRVLLHDAEAEPFAYLQHEGIARDSLVRVPPMDNQLQALLDGKVDVISGYSTDEAYVLQQQRFDYIELTPRAAGIDFYGDALFASERLLRSDPALVEAFRAASLRGWNEAFADVDGSIALIRQRYAPELSEGKLRFEAEQMRRLVFPDLIEMGYQHQGRWQSIAEVYQELGMLPPGARVEGMIYQVPQPLGSRMLNWVSLVILGGLLLLAWVAQRFYRLSRSLRLSNQALTERLRENQLLQDQLRFAAERDPLTNLYNRRYLYASLPLEIARAEREGYGVGLVLIDADYFKLVNDTYGHTAGDQVLLALADLLRGHARAGDILCRWGGEEFLLVLPRITLATLAQRVEQLRHDFSELAPLDVAPTRRFSFSAGYALYPDDGRDSESLILCADNALYAAKKAGRNQVMAAGQS